MRADIIICNLCKRHVSFKFSINFIFIVRCIIQFLYLISKYSKLELSKFYFRYEQLL